MWFNLRLSHLSSPPVGDFDGVLRQALGLKSVRPTIIFFSISLLSSASSSLVPFEEAAPFVLNMRWLQLNLSLMRGYQALSLRMMYRKGVVAAFQSRKNE